ncbi:large ribosomal subunit protein bL21m [Anabrus simplex]|uniref:large ribosomal subunit protein bL21m n=1 Tax=Anabrus simplex TaxID=316456 RepID=UPI0035A28258
MALSIVIRRVFQVSTTFVCHRCSSHTTSQISKLLGRNLTTWQRPFSSALLQAAFLHTPTKPAEQLQFEGQEVITDSGEKDKKISAAVISKVNQQIEQKKHGRLFAVVHVCGKQFKITNEDLIVLEGYWAPTVGDKIKLDKVLVVGSTDFTLFGRPILPRGLVSVEATVVEKSLSHTKTHFRKKRRKQYMRINFYRIHLTMLRITNISFTGKVNERKEVEGLEHRIF